MVAPPVLIIPKLTLMIIWFHLCPSQPTLMPELKLINQRRPHALINLPMGILLPPNPNRLCKFLRP